MTGAVPVAVQGNNGIIAKIQKGVAAAVEYDGNIKKIELTTEDKDDSDITFAEATSGDTVDYGVKLTALHSTAPTSLWRLLWDNPGTELVLTYGPHGNVTPTADKPHFLMTIKTGAKPPFEQEAKRTKERGTFEYEAVVTAGPTMLTS